jgi:uncharacterized Zn finger protein (UPF0148 family)
MDAARDPGAGGTDWAHVCDRCGETMVERQCKILCPRCGYTRDCSDP